MQAGMGQGMAGVEEEEGCKVVFLEVAKHNTGSPAVGEHKLITSVLCSGRSPGEQLSGNGSCISSPGNHHVTAGDLCSLKHFCAYS